MHLNLRAITASVAVGALLVTACDPTTGQPRPHPAQNTDYAKPGGYEDEGPFCGEVPAAPRGLRGEVIGWEYYDPGKTPVCLEIDPKDGKPVLVEVPRKVFDRCFDGDQFPECAGY